MKIVHISTSIRGGAGIAAFRLHQSMMNNPDIQSDLVQRFCLDDEFRKINNVHFAQTGRSLIIRALKKYNIHAEHYHWETLNNHPHNYEIATFATTSYRLEQLPVVKEADIIHLHWVAEFLNYPTFFKNVKQPIIWTLHDMNPFMGLFHYEGDDMNNKANFGKWDRKVRNTKLRAIHKHSDLHIVCLSEWMKEKSQSSEAFGKYPHYLIPNGLNFSQYPIHDKGIAKKEAKMDNGLKTILFVASGLDVKRKGFDLLINAINTLNRTDFNLISVGGDRIDVNNKINHIHYNLIEDVAKLNILYSAADITIIPSREDNLPNTMLESFANGTPVMSFTNGGMAEHVKTGVNGILIDKIDSESLVHAIEDFLNNKYIFDNETIRNYAVANFSDTMQIGKYIQLYKDILGR